MTGRCSWPGLRRPRRKGLAGIEDGVDAQPAVGLGELGHVLEVAGATMAMHSRGLMAPKSKPACCFMAPGLKPCNLIVGQIGGYVGRGGGLFINDSDVVGGQAALLEPLKVTVVVVTDGGDDAGLFAQQGQAVGDVAGGAAKVFPSKPLTVKLTLIMWILSGMMWSEKRPGKSIMRS